MTYEVVVQSSVLVRGRIARETYERTVTVYNAKSAVDARKSVQGKLEKGERIVSVSALR